MSRPQPDLGQISGYRLTGFLGDGGQGTVYRGLSPSGDEVAVKVLHARMSEDAEERRRFFRQVELARRVAPFCTARVLDMGMHDDRPYIVSEYVRGDSLDRVVRQDGPRTGGGLDRLAVATATALAAIHRAGVVHRDFKPGNVILGPEGPVVIDFGISRALDHAVTQSGAFGTPGYMAPEQVSSDRSDFGSDRLISFDPATERFTPANGEAAGVRQIHGRPGEVWGAASGEDALLLVRTSSG
ncbi:protein kinase-like protein [Nonomuraea polychroma]|uniref:Protein kinase-like protein n=1 Tax=Nonomuraea polychroma TaxID=46176 RepID=A0A438LYY6_9ACTN|nr:serine/threonine-protein kinase [Nonomuraea polychroma]RVX38468.1 protein kinase-like protein [Nonomuraea polychroma]